MIGFIYIINFNAMIKVSVLYPNEESKAFDWDYYCGKHVPMVMGLLGDSLKKAEIVQGISGDTPDSNYLYRNRANVF